MKKTMRIGTHSGSFHCDEALACFMLKNHVKQFKNAEIVRSRDPDVWKTCDILVDVGAEYNPKTHRYDHHQREFTGVFNNTNFNRTKLSSAGLIYKHFGKEVIGDILAQHKFDTKTVELFWLKMYETFIEAVDGIDNGVNQYDGEPHYESSTDLGSRVKKLNPWWNKESTDELLYSQFEKAMALTGKEFSEKLIYYAECWWPARAIVEKSLGNCKSIHPSGEIMLLEHYCPWKKHLFELEIEQKIEGKIKYVVFNGSDKSWRVQCVPEGTPDSFNKRKPLHEDWKGLRDDDLCK
eukprot:UN24207